jgi:hypoxanthine phosphoribosyltransferase
LSESKAIVNYPWNTIDDLVKEVANRASSFKPTHIVGITRGGLIPAVMLSHSFDLPMETLGVSFRDNRATHHTKFKPIDDARYLIVDDINDSGTTFKVVSDIFRNRRLIFATAALINKEKSGFDVDFYGEMFYHDDWINFPWEK